MKLRRAPLLTLAAVALVAIGLAACGGSSNSSENASAASTMPTGSVGDTVSTKSISGTGTVLVDSKGAALYTNNQDSGMKVACTDSCTAIWVPLMAPTTGQPASSDHAVQSKLGTVNANGGSQVTFGGKPLYTFTEDSPGQVTGNGFSDQFDGTSFTWTVASTGPVSSSSNGTSTSSGSSSSGRGYGSGGSSGGGYGY
jgi:predicted lipoprotein with Yx(FWY)xxD motif